MNTYTRMVSEEEFYEFHENLKASGCNIIRCIQIDGGKTRIYQLTWAARA